MFDYSLSVNKPVTIFIIFISIKTFLLINIHELPSYKAFPWNFFLIPMQDTVTKGGMPKSSSHFIKFPFPILLYIYKLIFFSCPFLSCTNAWPYRRAEAGCVYVYNVPIPLFGQMLFHKSTKVYLILEGLARMPCYLFP